jgi:hypothetical protein
MERYKFLFFTISKISSIFLYYNIKIINSSTYIKLNFFFNSDDVNISYIETGFRKITGFKKIQREKKNAVSHNETLLLNQ